MEKVQELGKHAMSSAREKAQEIAGENFQLNYSNAQQNLKGNSVEETAYNLIDHRVTYHKTQYSYNEELNKYTEAAFNNYVQPAESNVPSSAAQSPPPPSAPTPPALPDNNSQDASGRIL